MLVRRLPVVLLIALVGFSAFPGGNPAAMDVDAPLADPAQQETYERLIHEVRCLVCMNQTIADSSAPLAADLRKEVRELVAAGQSEDQVKTFLLDRYGDFVLYRPRFTLETALLWLAPGLLLVLGGFALLRIVRRRVALPVPPEDPGDDLPPA